MYEMCAKLTVKTLERHKWTDSTYPSGVSIVDFEQVKAGWAVSFILLTIWTVSSKLTLKASLEAQKFSRLVHSS